MELMILETRSSGSSSPVIRGPGMGLLTPSVMAGAESCSKQHPLPIPGLPSATSSLCCQHLHP